MKNPIARDVFISTALILGFLTAGCGGGYGGGGGGGYGSGSGSGGTSCVAIAGGAPVVIDLNDSLAACADTTYGSTRGFSSDNVHSQIVKIPVGSNVVFSNTGTTNHAADLLGNSYPGTDTNPGTAAAPNTDISTANFSTGTIAMGTMSATYKAGVTGLYYFGDHFDYVSMGMRTILWVY